MENSKTTGWKHKSTNKLSEKQQAKVGKVMHEFKEGELHSGSKKGPIVKDRDQAIAIALSEAKSMDKMKRGAVLTPLDVKDGDIFKTIDGDIIQLSIINSDKDGKYYILRHYPLNNSKPENTLLPFEFDRYYKAGLYEKVDPSSLIKKENKMVRGGYTNPGYDVKTTGVYLFKTKNGSFNVVSYLFERENDTEDSLEIQDDLRDNLGSILIQNSSWKRLSSGKPVKAKSAYGDYVGTLTRIDDTKNLKKYITGTYNDYAFKDGGGVDTITLENPYKNSNFLDDIARENINKIFGKVSFKKFGNEFRKNINPYFTKEDNSHRLTKSFRWSDFASYIIGDGSYAINEEQYNNFIKNFNTTYEDKYEGGGTIEVGDKVKASKEYGGKSGRVVDKMGSFVVVEYSNGQSDSYHESDLIKKMENGGGVKETKKPINYNLIIKLIKGADNPTNQNMFYSSYSNSIQLYERQNGPQARLTGYNLVNFFRQPQGSSMDILELFKDAAKNPVKTKSKIESLSQNKIYVDISELGWGNEVIVKYKPRFTESDKMKDGGELEKMSLTQLLDKVPIFEQMHIEGYSEYTKAKMAYDDFNNETGNKHLSFEEKRIYDAMSQRRLKSLSKYKENVIKYLQSNKVNKKMSGGKLTALIEDVKEFDKNIYPKNSDISYKNRLIIAHFKTKGYSIIEIAKALKIIRN